jgi:PAS domain S-box-containing protein
VPETRLDTSTGSSVFKNQASSVYDATMAATGMDRLTRWTVEYALRPLAIASFFVLVAFLWSILLQHLIAYPFVLLFFGAVMGSAWFGGIVAGLLAVAMSTIIIDYFFVPPLFSLSVASQSQSFLAAVVLCAIVIGLVSSARKRADNAIHEARDQLEARILERTAELQQSNLDLLESGRRLRTLTEAIPQQMWSADSRGQIEFCNQHLIEYIGNPIEGLLGEAFLHILHPVDERLFRQVWHSASRTGERFEVEARVLGSDRAYRWFLIRSIPQLSEDNRVARWYGIHIDIEQQHSAQQGLIVAQDELLRLSRTLSMGELAASIAHELNQPLTAVVTHAYACREWLRTSPPNLEKATNTADKIVQESTRAAAVVARVRALFRKEASLRERTDINHLVLDLIRLLRDEAVRRNISIKLRLAEDLPQVDLDPIQIQQVLLNLAMNGMDAMANSIGARELAIFSEMDSGNEIMLTVEDRGAGLSPEIAARMFEPFFSNKPHGTGIGLAICRSIIEEHDGRIWATESSEGGARFQFTIPVQS